MPPTCPGGEGPAGTKSWPGVRMHRPALSHPFTALLALGFAVSDRQV